MNLLTNGSASNCGPLFEPSEEFEADIVELWLNGFRYIEGKWQRRTLNG